MTKTTVGIPSCIKENFVPPNDDGYEAFLYRFVNLVNGMIYLGWHLGYPFDGYWQSSTCDVFNLLFEGSEPIFRYEVLDYGTRFDMENLEHKMLKEVDAVNNPQYYNKSNGRPAFKEDRLDVCKEIVKRFEDGEFRGEHKELIEDLGKLERLQVRTVDFDTEHITEIKNALPENGNTDNCEDILIWEDVLIDGVTQDLIGDGNHTLKATQKHKKSKSLRTSRIPRSYWYDELHLTDNEMQIVGDMRNKRSEIIKKRSSDDDILNRMIDYKERLGVDFKSKTTKVMMEEVYGLKTHNQRKNYYKKATNSYSDKILQSTGHTWISYKKDVDEEAYEELQTTVEQWRDNYTIALAINSAITNKVDLEINRALVCPRNLNKYKVILVVWHPKPTDKEQWNKQWPAIKDRWETLFNKCYKLVEVKSDNGDKIETKRTIDVEYMKTTRPKVKQDKQD